MKLSVALEIALFGHAIAQAFDPFLSFISSELLPTSTTGIAVSTSSTLPTAPGTRSVTTTSAASSAAIATTTTTASLGPSSTFDLVTDSTDVPSSTVASTATPTTPSTASADGGPSGDRVAVIALASILGALLIGLTILGFVLLRRRKIRRATQSRLADSRNEPLRTEFQERPRSTSWLGSLRNGHRSTKYSSTPRQQFARATTQPLMSEGSPVYGFNSPSQTRPAPLFSGSTQSRPRNSATNATNESRNVGTNIATDPAEDSSSSPPITGSATINKQVDINHSRNLSDHDIGNPYIDSNPKSPELFQLQSQAKTHKIKPSQDGNGQLQYAALASHPVAHAAEASSTNALEVPGDNEDRGTERSSSIPRDGFANAIAGLGIDPDDANNKASPAQSRHPDASLPVAGTSNDKAARSRAGENLIKTSVERKAIPQREETRPSIPHLSIPKTFVPIRQISKRTRFSIAGNEEVSPTSESWLDIDGGERAHYRRASTISPISPDRNERRAYSENNIRRTHDRSDSIDETEEYDLLAPVALSSRAGSNMPKQALEYGLTNHNMMVPGVHHVLQNNEEQPPQQYQQVKKPKRASAPAESVKRKPAPIDLATLIRKPLPPHPVPTSKYNRTSKPIVRPQPAITSAENSNYASKYENADEMSAKLKGDPASQVPRVATPTVYDEMVKGMSGMQGRPSHLKQNIDNPQYRGKARIPESEVVDNNVIISSYLQPSRASSQHETHIQRPQIQTNLAPAHQSNRDTVQFFRDPGNQEYAQVYGNYYSQPSPVQFNSPTSPQKVNMQYPPTQPYIQPYRPSTQQEYSYIPNNHQERSRYLSPPPQMPPQMQTQPRTFPLQQGGQNAYIKPTYQQATHPSANTRQMRDPDSTIMNHTTAMAYPWRDSQQDAWRDSLSRSGSDPASAGVGVGPSGSGRGSAGNGSGSGNGAAPGTNVATSNASSGGGGGPGLWGSPDFFGAER